MRVELANQSNHRICNRAAHRIRYRWPIVGRATDPTTSLTNLSSPWTHDCIYGDCFDWLVRLAKRKELYDIVILDPPSTSIGQKRKRWSIQDIDELVALAVPLVKKGGFLWTTTNSGSLPITKFVRLCHKGLVDAGVQNAKLERIQPMPTDFSCVGPQPVKNLVWRIP